MERQLLSIATLLLVTAAPAHAVLYGGNPVMTLFVDRPEADLVDGSVLLSQVKLHACGGGINIWNVNVTIDPVDGWSMNLPAGDHCRVDLVWGNTMELDGQGYALDYDEASTSVTLSGASQSAALTPFDVVSGSFSGNGPSVWLTIQ